MTERRTTDITSKMRREIPVFSQTELNLNGRVVTGSSVAMCYEGSQRLVFGQTIHIKTVEGLIYEGVIGHSGSKGKVYVSVKHQYTLA